LDKILIISSASKGLLFEPPFEGRINSFYFLSLEGGRMKVGVREV